MKKRNSTVRDAKPPAVMRAGSRLHGPVPAPEGGFAALLLRGNRADLETHLNRLKPAETALLVARLDDEERERLFRILEPGQAADVIRDLTDEQAADVIEDLDTSHAASIVERLADDERADVLGDIPNRRARAILRKLPLWKAAQTRRLMAYPDATAGGLMTSDFVAFPQYWTVRRTIRTLRRNHARYARFDVQYVYVRDHLGRLAGILRLRDLLLAPEQSVLSDLMLRETVLVRTDEPMEGLIPLFRERGFMGLPVVDRRRRILGVVTRQSAFEALGDDSQRQFLKMSGILGGEEFRGMPFRRRAGRRLSWLGINVLLNILAASVIAANQDILSAAVVLAVFLPIISDMSGCSGNQAVAVSIRELSLGLIRPREVARVLGKEIGLGAVNGTVLGGLVALAAFLWKGNACLGLVVGSALALNTMLSVCLGGVLPLLLRRFRMDPALASGPILTTLTDMAGFFMVLRFAGLVLPRLAG